MSAVARRPSLRLARRAQPCPADRALVAPDGAATVIILLMLIVVVGDVLVGGLRVVSWEFISAAPREGMTKGGIFPAILGPSPSLFS